MVAYIEYALATLELSVGRYREASFMSTPRSLPTRIC